ncbi:MAG TPA: hypothetical protein VLW17_10415 [Thermoanaerobaculaceae bacterium]|nr:hypothetical protein [Thermoanaerobaculaceae bacterium]
MNAKPPFAALALGIAALAAPAAAATDGRFSLQVLLDGTPRPEYRARGTVYVEAVRGRDYVLRVTNPLPVRVAVALAVDGLNTIDARHSAARDAAKWVLDPYETIEISGWQTSGSEARRFFFTGERSSYGAWLGQTANLGVIEAVFYRERTAPVAVVQNMAAPQADAGRGGSPAPSSVGESAGEAQRKSASAVGSGRLADDYAATGIGEVTRHEVERVHLDLEDAPAATVRIRYEFHEQLARLGVLPASPDPLDRRERARGFNRGYCPDPAGGRF